MTGDGASELSAWARGLGLTAPIVCAPMGGVAGGRLASAVSLAGGLGMIGMGSAGSAAALERELGLLDARVRSGEAPFGVGMVGWGLERDPAMLELAIESGAALISVSFGDWGADPHPSWIAAVQRAGALAATQVATAEEARKAEAAGVDAVVARGREGGGHGIHVEPRDALLREVLEAVEVPVLAAGAVRDGAELSRVLREGAAAAWIGTAFSACTEALTGEPARAALFAATGADTTVSRVLDVALERPWPEHVPERLVRTAFVDRWQGREEELARDGAARAEFRAALAAADYSVVPVDAGEGVGALRESLPAAEVIAGFTRKVA